MEAAAAIVIFAVAYAAIVAEKVHRTVVALIAGVLMVMLRLLPQHEAYEAVDWNVIFLLIGMMIIVDVLEDTGVFQWLEAQCVRLAKGDPLKVAVLLCFMTAVLSAFLNNVTTIVLTVPLTIRVAKTLGMRAAPLIIAQVLASNIGGTATLIGDPPNILIGSAAKLTFLDFLVHLTPVIAVITLVFCVILRWVLRADLPKTAPDPAAVLHDLPEITDPLLLKRTLSVLALVVLGFLLHGALHLEASTIALGGAALARGRSPTAPKRLTGRSQRALETCRSGERRGQETLAEHRRIMRELARFPGWAHVWGARPGPPRPAPTLAGRRSPDRAPSATEGLQRLET